MGNLETRLDKLEAAIPNPRPLTPDDISRLTDAEYDHLNNSLYDVNLLLLTYDEFRGLLEAYENAKASGVDGNAFMTPELTAALERARRDGRPSLFKMYDLRRMTNDELLALRHCYTDEGQPLPEHLTSELVAALERVKR